MKCATSMSKGRPPGLLKSAVCSPVCGAWPLVSILIPCYNAARWIRECIQSALDQTYLNKEVIVLDDGSTDASAEIIERFADQVSFYRAEHAGGNAARNRLTQLARGEWLQFLDADDYMLPGKIASQFDQVRPDVDIIYSPVIFHDVLHPQKDYVMEIKDKRQDDEGLTLIRWGALNTGGLLMRRDAVLSVGSWKTDQRCCQEHELLSRMIVAGHQFAFSDAAEVVYRKHSSTSVSRVDPLRVIRMRAEITDKIVAYLESAGRLTERHREALYIARMESARTAVSGDITLASHLSASAMCEGNRWIFGSPALPFWYQLSLRILGFLQTERFAAWIRHQRSAKFHKSPTPT